MPRSVAATAEPVDTWERHAAWACAPLRGYRRREPEKTLLHVVVREWLESFIVAARLPWAELLRKVFALDVLACPECGGRMQIIAFIAQPKVARRILEHLGFDSTGPPVARAQAQPEEFDPGPDYSAPDLTYD